MREPQASPASSATAVDLPDIRVDGPDLSGPGAASSPRPLAVPETTITSAPPRFTNSDTALFAFSSATGTTFSHRLDEGAWSSWDASTTADLSPVAGGAHRFEVKARDATLTEDPTPAVYAWRVITAPRSLDLSSGAAPDFWAYGEGRFDFAGFSVAAGDVNGDGHRDMLIGAPNAPGDTGSPAGAGRAYLIFGSATVSGGRDLQTQSADVVFYGAAFNEQLGTSVATGDVDGDGCDDLLLASPFSNAARVNAGVVTLIFGRGACTTAEPFVDWDLADPPAVEYVTLYGAEANDVTGLSVATGDVNGDTFADIIIDAETASPLGRTRAGRVHVVFGRPRTEWATLGDLSDPDPAQLPARLDLAVAGRSLRIFGAEGSETGVGGGDSLRAIGAADLSGDGNAEILLLARGADGAANSRPEAGEAYIVTGDPALSSGDVMDLRTAPVTTIFGAAGAQLVTGAGGGNFNKDTSAAAHPLADLALGAADALGGEGAVYIVFGAEALPATIDLATAWDVRIRGGVAQEQLGAAVLLAEVDGDGYADLVMTAWTNSNAGKVTVLGGAPFTRGAQQVDFDLSTVSPDRAYLGRAAGSLFGFSLAAANITGDVADDLLVGAVFSSGGATIPAGRDRDLCGEAYLLGGGSPPSGPAAGPPVKLVLYGEGILPMSECGAFTVDARDEVGLDSSVSSAVSVDLSVTGANGPYVLYADDTCTTATGRITVAAGTSTAPVYFKSSTVEQVVLHAQDVAALLAPSDWAVEIRARTGGQLDASFNGTGKIATQITSGGAASTKSELAYAMHMIPSGQFIVVGSAKADIGLVKYRYDGGLDRNFGAGSGYVITDFLGYTDQARAVAVQPNGFVVVAGIAYTSGSYPIVALARYDSDGNLDTAFNGTGKVTTDPGGTYHWVSGVAAVGGNKILVAGQYHSGVNVNHLLVRYLSNGALDTTFGSSGLVIHDLGSDEDYVRAMAVQTDGKILLAGAFYNGAGAMEDLAVTRYLDNGGVDTGFGVNGTALIDFGVVGDDGAEAIEVLEDGRILLAGKAAGPVSGSDCDFAMARLLPSGALDTSFGTGGKVRHANTGDTTEVAVAVAVQGDGKIVLSGSMLGSSGGKNFTALRYYPDGTLDTSFGTSGVAAVDFFGGQDDAYAVEIDWQGNTVIVGATNNGTNYDIAVARISGGFWDRFDPYFGSANGLASFDYIGTGDYSEDVCPLPDGGVVLAGYVGGGTGADMLLLKLTADGAKDITFGAAGYAVGSFSATHDYGEACGVQDSGKVVAAGYSTGSVNMDALVARFDTGGSVDASFGAGGYQRLDGGPRDYSYAMALDSDGAIVGCGHQEFKDWLITRFGVNGIPDTGFNGSGLRVLNMAVGTAEERCEAVTVQPDGKIVAVGYVVTGGWADITVVRLNPDGSDDLSFDGDGRVTTVVGNGDCVALAVALQPDGKVLVAGESYLSYRYIPTLLRYLPDGSLDDTFGAGGIVLLPQVIEANTEISVVLSGFYDLAVQRDGKITGVGFAYHRGDPTRTLLLMRVNSDGSPDSSFYPRGYCARPVDSTALSVIWAGTLAETRDGRYVSALSASGSGTLNDMAAARFRP